MIGTRPVVMPALLWTHVMNLYTTDPTTGAYTVAGAANLPCRLCETGHKDSVAWRERAQGLESRVLLFEPSQVVDPASQVEILGHRYQVQSGSDQAARGPGGEIVYRSVDVLNVTSGADL